MPANLNYAVDSSSAASQSLRVLGYIERQSFIEKRCLGKRVLDLGVVATTCEPFEKRLAYFPSTLHRRLAKVASRLVGVDHAEAEIAQLKALFPELCLYAGDVHQLSNVVPHEEFDVVVMGNLIEHLSNPGLALDEIQRFLSGDGELIVTCPNAFGLPKTLRFYFGRFREGPDHVQSYTKHTLANLLSRHGFYCTEIWTGLDHEPRSRKQRLLFRVGAPILRLFPDLGGTLIVVARSARKAQANLGPNNSE